MDKLILSLDFTKKFDYELAKYGRSIINNANDFETCQRAKELFRDNLFNWFIKMINDKEKPDAIPNTDNQQDNKNPKIQT